MIYEILFTPLNISITCIATGFIVGYYLGIRDNSIITKEVENSTNEHLFKK